MKTTGFVVVVGAGLLALVLAPGSAEATIPTGEREALIDIYNGTTGAGWTHRDNWRNVGDTDFEVVGTECTWYGVTCDETEDHVTRISLKSNNLNGSIPTSIGDFPSLVLLELLGNHNLTGPIPASIGNLAALQTFNAYDGSLSGSIPPEIGNLSNLDWLELSYNQLDGAIPPEIGHLTSLTELDLQGNLISGAIPPEIGDLASLRNLRLAENQLSGSIPSEIGNLTNLGYLILYSNQLSGSLPPEIGDLTSLSSLDLSENGLTGAIPSEIGNLTSLWTLILSNNSLSGLIPAEIGDMEELRNLRIQGNVLGGPIPDEIVKLVKLNDGSGLRISYNALYTASHAVDAFLELKHSSFGDWSATQTVAPTDISVGLVTNSTVELTWTPIDYTADSGGYTAWYSTVSGGSYTRFGTITDKTVNSITVLGLSPLQPYYFYVDAVTDPHGSNQNTVVSNPSLEVSTRTSSGGGPTLSIGDATVVEGDSGTVNAVFTVSLYPASGGVATVTAVSGDETASAGSDYQTTSVPLVFSPGETSQTVSVPVYGDTDVEGDETFFVQLVGGSGAMGGRTLATATIQNDDAGLVSHERQALIDLYNSTNGGNWTTRTNWRNAGDTDFGESGTECTWHGVTCDVTNQRVEKIDLYANNLTGTIPGSIGEFSALEIFRLTGNDMVGEIPAEIGNLAALRIFALAYNGAMTGSIPPEIGGLSNLTALYLTELGLSGPIPANIGQLSSLTTLDLGQNLLSGAIPPRIGSLTNLRYLYLSFNQLSGSIPEELRNLSNLESLALRRNTLSGSIPPELSQISSLRSLILSENQLTGFLPPEIGSLPQLGSLSVRQNQLTGSIPPELGNLSNLYSLDLTDNQFSGEIPLELGSLSNLSGLQLRTNQLSGGIPQELGSLLNLWRLDVGDNQLSGEVPPELGDLSNLNYLQLDSNRLTGSLPAALADLTSLRDMTGLDLRWNGLHTDQVFLAAFLNTKHANLGDWRDTQTVAPENLIVTSMNDHTVWLSWDFVDYIEDEGGYEIFFAPTGSGSWVSGGWTSDKSVTLFPVTGLVPATIYDLAVVSYTAPHIDNQNWVTSDFSGTEMATTSDVGCSEPGIAIDFSAGISLSVPGSFTTYDWSTGESTAAIVVDPPEAQWYWVEVTSAGGCIDTAAKWVAPWVFANDFEFGDLSGWSSATP